MYKAEIKVTLRKSILDPKGKASLSALQRLGYDNVNSVRIGKFIEMEIEAGDHDQATQIAKEAAEKLLSNPVMEDFSVVLTNGRSATE